MRSIKILVTGASGMLGRCILNKLNNRCLSLGVDLPGMNITDAGMVRRVTEEFNPDMIINTAAITDVDRCEREPDLADDVNWKGVENLCETGVPLVTVSTDQVFTDGRGVPLTEDSPVEPVNHYALSKLRGEEAALMNPANRVVRTSWLNGSRGMIPWMESRLLRGETVSAVADQSACITNVEDLADAILRIVFDELPGGLYHCVNPGPVTPFYTACVVRNALGRGNVVPVEWAGLSLPAARPLWSALGSSRELKLPPFERALERCMRTIR